MTSSIWDIICSNISTILNHFSNCHCATSDRFCQIAPPNVLPRTFKGAVYWHLKNPFRTFSLRVLSLFNKIHICYSCSFGFIRHIICKSTYLFLLMTMLDTELVYILIGPHSRKWNNFSPPSFQEKV